jgi:hypothetical protein
VKGNREGKPEGRQRRQREGRGGRGKAEEAEGRQSEEIGGEGRRGEEGRDWGVVESISRWSWDGCERLRLKINIISKTVLTVDEYFIS